MVHRAPPKDNPDLLAKALGGDRDAVASFLCRNAARIKRRYRARLRGPVRRLIDADDIFSAIAQRLDAYVLSGRFAVESEAQLWALIFRIGDRAVSRHAKQSGRLRSPESPNGPHPHRHGAPSERPDLTFVGMLREVHRAEDRELLRLRLVGVPYAVIAPRLGVSPAAARKRWQRLIADLQRRTNRGRA